MNNTNPLIPQGSLLEQAPKGRSRFMVAVYSVAGIHVAFLAVILLIVGCNGEKSKLETAQNPTESPVPPPDLSTSGAPALPPMTAMTSSNPPAAVPPPAPYVPPAPPEPTTKEYVVVKGDTLDKLHRDYHVSVKALIAANPNVVPNKLKVGEKIQIPASDTSASHTLGADAAMSAGSAETYTVKSGDNLTKIASAHGTTVKALRAANNLKTDKINVGTKLKLPAKAAAPVVEPAPVSVPSVPPSMPAAPGSITPGGPVR